MIQRDLQWIKDKTGGAFVSDKRRGQKDRGMIHGVSIDTRTLEKGNLFLPLKGTTDGHRFIPMAMERGCGALLCEDSSIDEVKIAIQNAVDEGKLSREELPPIILVENTEKALQDLASSYRMEVNPQVIGITGSDGKTSTKDLLEGILRGTYRTHKTKGNFNNLLGLPLTLLDMKEDTEVAVLEMGMSSLGEIKRLTEIAKPDRGIIVNVSDTHLEEVGSLEGILQAKFELFDGIKDGGTLVYHGDHRELEGMVKEGLQRKALRVFSFGEGEHCDFRISPGAVTDRGVDFSVESSRFKKGAASKSGGKSTGFFIPLLGAHQMYNGTAAIALAISMGLGIGEILEGLSRGDFTKMRMEIREKQGYRIINDAYKSTPASLRAAISFFSSMETGEEKVMVLGDLLGLGGDERKKHYEIGKTIDETRIHQLIVIGPLARHLGMGAMEKLGEGRVMYFNGKEEMNQHLETMDKRGKILMFKGSRGVALEGVIDNLI